VTGVLCFFILSRLMPRKSPLRALELLCSDNLVKGCAPAAGRADWFT
jgi:hypothetical protein